MLRNRFSQRSAIRDRQSSATRLSLESLEDRRMLAGMANQPPVAVAGTDVAGTVGIAIALDATGSFDTDECPAPLTYAWEVLGDGLPSDNLVQFDDPSSATPMVTANQAGTYELTLTVSDGESSSSDMLALEIVANQAPFANARINDPIANTRFAFSIDGSTSLDPENQALTFDWSVLESPPGSVADFADSQAETAMMTADTPGDYLVQLIVNDGIQSSAPFQFPITFQKTPEAGGPYVVIAGQDLQFFGPTVVSGNGGETSWRTDGRSIVFGNDSLVTWDELEMLLGPEPAGIHSLEAEVFIGSGAFTTYRTTLTVIDPTDSQTSDFPAADAVFGDIDGDGDLDAVGRAVDQPGGELQAFINDGQGNFVSRDAAPGESLSLASADALADFDNDGDLDLVITPGSKPTTLLLNEKGVFQSVDEFATDNSFFGEVIATDADFDGDTDLFVVDEAGIGLYLNDAGALSFDEQLFLSDSVEDVLLGPIVDVFSDDLDGDNIVDFIIERDNGSKDMWLSALQTMFPTGIYGQSRADLSHLPELSSLHDVAVDLDNDGDADLVGDDRVYLQDGTRRFFDAQIDLAFSDFSREIKGIGDFNQDGHVDLIGTLDGGTFTNQGTNLPLRIFLNDGLATFTDHVPLDIALERDPLGSGSYGEIHVQDFDRDGQPDILSPATAGSDDGRIWFNQIVSSTWHNSLNPADVNDDGVVSPLDPILVINELNSGRLNTASNAVLPVAPPNVTEFIDVNNDGRFSPVDAIEAINQINSGLAPLLKGLPPVVVNAGLPFIVPLDGFTMDGADITYTATSDRPGLVSTTIPGGNRSLRIGVSSPANDIEGEMVFQLWENFVPRITDRVIELAETGFYDGLKFHEIVGGAWMRGGDPQGNGTGGSALPDIDDQYHPNLRHRQTGVISMTRPYEDANNSQFLITDGGNNSLASLSDFDYSPFGLLVEGDVVRQAIGNVPATPDGLPTHDVFMTDVDVLVDNQNGLLILNPTLGRQGIANITVTATSGNRTESRTFEVDVQSGGFSSEPYLEDIPTITTPVNTEVTYQLVGIQLHPNLSVNYLGPDEVLPIAGDFPVQFPPADVTVTVDEDTGLMTIVPTNDYTGTFEVTVGIGTFHPDDLQTITVVIE